jgi:hypothetical protein
MHRSKRRAWVSLFDDLVGEQLDRVGHLDAECSRRLQVDDELEFGRLHNRQVRRLGALEDIAGINADLKKTVREIGRIAHQAAGFDSLASGMGRGNPLARRKRRKLDAPANEEPVGGDEQGLGLLANEDCKGCLDFAAGAGVEDLDLQSDGACRFRYIS